MCGNKEIAAAVSKFSVGDKVSYTNYTGQDSVPVGSVGKIIMLNVCSVTRAGHRVTWDTARGKRGGSSSFVVDEDNLKPHETPVEPPSESHRRPEVGDTIELLRDYAGGLYNKGERFVLREGPNKLLEFEADTHNDGKVYFSSESWGEAFAVVAPSVAPPSYPKVGDKVLLKPTGGAFDSHAPVYGQIVDKTADLSAEEVRYTVIPVFGDHTRQRSLTSDDFTVVR